MKNFFLVVFLVATQLTKAQTGSITVSVPKFKNNKGQCMICIFSNPADFPSERSKAFKCINVPITNFTVTTTIKDIPTGVYAIAVLHDENSNGTLDENFLGIPKEGYGASNNILPKMSKPKFEPAKFTLTANGILNFSINLKY